MSTIPTYVLITPARNESKFIELTLQVGGGADLRPLKWVIVSDGSTDGTDEIVEQATRLSIPGSSWCACRSASERNFAGKVHAFNAGYARVKDLQPDAIGNLDAERSFEPGHFEFLVAEIRGVRRARAWWARRSARVDQQYDYRFSNIENVWGGCQLFRRQCFEDIGGYVPVKGGCIDHIAVVPPRNEGLEDADFH